MRQASKRIPEALKRQSGIFAEPHAGIIPLKRRQAPNAGVSSERKFRQIVVPSDSNPQTPLISNSR